MEETSYFWVEGVDFDVTLYDTQDLSTVRGASLALYRLGRVLGERLGKGVHSVFAGGSQAAFQLTGAGASGMARDALADLARDPLFAQMSIAHGFAVVSGGDADLALTTARARALAARQRKLSVPNVSEPGAWRPCEFDRLRGATTQIRVGDDLYWASPSVAARRSHGRERRQSFYVNEGGLTRDEVEALFPAPTPDAHGRVARNFTDSFEQLIADPPDGAPDSVRNKMAVIYLDGNGMTKIIDALANQAGTGLAEAYHTVSKVLDERLREHLLRPLLETFKADARRPAPLETLLWGGDEVMFVVPAWKAIEVARDLTRALTAAGWEIDVAGEKRAITFAVGMVIAHHKTPIALLKQAAEDLANALKEVDRTRTQIAIEVLESLEIPAEGVVEARRRSLGLEAIWPQDGKPEARIGKPIGAFYALDGALFERTCERLAALKRQLPASQIHRWAHLARDQKRFGLDRDPRKLEAAIADYGQRIRGQPIRLALEAGAGERPLAWDLVLLKTLLDYLETYPAAAEGDAAWS